MNDYNNDDIVITDINETMTYAEAKKFNAPVYRIATKKESEEYRKEVEYWRKQSDQEQHEGSYHELPE